MKIFIKQNWFKLCILLIVFSILSLLFIKIPNTEREEKQDCNIAKIDLNGELFVSESELSTDNTNDTASETIVQEIERAKEDRHIKGIILNVNSVGGSMVGGEQIMQALKASKKPTVALINEEGLSASYFASTGANKIIASKFSDVVDIGITASYVENSQKDTQEGLTFVPLATGKYKDMFNLDKPMTDEEKDIVMKHIKVAHDNFVAGVAENRHLSLDTVKSFAIGLTMTAEDAFKNGFIDQIGGIQEVKDYFKKETGKDIKICK